MVTSKTNTTSDYHIVIEPPKRWAALDLLDVWHYRDLLFILAWRDVKVRYKQTVLGATWAILQPLLTMIIFSLIFGNLAKLPSDGIPYPIFTFTALLPWQLFAFSLGASSNSLISSERLIAKVYFPRLIIPISSVLAGVIDFVISFFVLLGLMFFYGVPLNLRMLILPLYLVLALVSALSVGIWFSALNVKYRDFRYVVPFLSQAWMYATPIAYSSSLIPDKWKLIYGLNPMTGVVEGFRWVLLGTGEAADPMIIVSIVVVLGLFLSGLFYFKRMENHFADLI